MPAADTTIEAARIQRQAFANKTAEQRAMTLIERLHGRELAIAVADAGLIGDGY